MRTRSTNRDRPKIWYDDDAQGESNGRGDNFSEGEEAEGDYNDDEARWQDEDEEDEESGDPDCGKSRRRDKESSRQRHSW